MLILVDGQFVKEEDPILNINDLNQLILKIPIRINRNILMFFPEHVSDICRYFSILGCEIPSFLEQGGKELKRQIERALIRNKLFKSAVVSLYFFQGSQGIRYLIQTGALKADGYELNREGLVLELETGIFKATAETSLSAFRIGSEPYWKILQAGAADHQMVRILLNQKGSLLEAPDRNLYLICGEQVLTPAPLSGACINPAQKHILEAVHHSGLTSQEEPFLNPEELRKADEIFLAGDLHGIQWVKAFREKRYLNRKIRLIEENFRKDLPV